MSEALLKALEIQPEDLDANRNGEFSKRQIRQLHSRIRAKLIPMFLFVFMMFILILFMGSGMWGQYQQIKETSAGFFAVGLLIILAIMGISTGRLIFREWMKASNDLKAAELSVIRGPVRLQIEKDHRGDSWHFVRIGSQKFRVFPPIYAAFEEKEKYAIYYVSTTREVVGAEKID